MGLNLAPAYRVVANNEDITGKIQSRLISLRLVDEAGVQSDTLEITLADHDAANTIQMPSTGAEIRVSLGYDGSAREMGLFIVDEVEISGPPRQMRISAHASPHDQTPGGIKALQTQHSRSWPDGATIGDIVKKCASDAGLEPAVSDGLASIELPHIDQSNESDMNLLTRIARDHGAVAKPGGGRLLMVRRGESKSASGKSLSAITLTPQDVTHWSALYSKRDPAGSVIATYRDHAKSEDVEVVVGDGEPVRRLPHTYSRASSARRAAQSALKQTDRAGKSLRCTLPGNPALIAETPLNLTRFRDGANGTWTITRATHDVSQRGYICSVEAEAARA